MNVELAEGIVTEVVFGERLATPPRWGLRSSSLMIAPYHSGDEHELHYEATVGSGDWYRSEYDEFRFGKDDHMLRSLWLHVPNENLNAAELLPRWRDAPPLSGVLRLLTQRDFAPAPTAYRWLEPSGEVLAGLHPASLRSPGEMLRLRAAPDFDMLFVNRRFAGWLLWSPLRYLTSGWSEATQTDEPDTELVSQLGRYLELIATPNFAAMEEKNPDTRGALLELRDRFAQADAENAQRAILRESLEAVIKNFYGELVR